MAEKTFKRQLEIKLCGLSIKADNGNTQARTECKRIAEAFKAAAVGDVSLETICANMNITI